MNEKSFLYHCYPDGNGPDSELIQLLEKDVVDLNPNIKFEDIAELDKAKEILQEAVLLPIMIPAFFKVRNQKKINKHYMILCLCFSFKFNYFNKGYQKTLERSINVWSSGNRKNNAS